MNGQNVRGFGIPGVHVRVRNMESGAQKLIYKGVGSIVLHSDKEIVRK